MKRHAYMMIALMVLVGLMAVAAQAQTGSRTQLVANIPFQFNVGDKAMPAGEYTVSQVNPSSDHAVLQLRSKDGKNTMMIQMTNMIGKEMRPLGWYSIVTAMILTSPKPGSRQTLTDCGLQVEERTCGAPGTCRRQAGNRDRGP
jgi:membrane-bound ClpP family serine protease